MFKESTTLNKTLTIIILLSFLIAIGANFYKYYYTKNYDYLLEAKCDPAIEKCFERDCTNPDDCPPDGLSDYKEFNIKAYDFPKCSDKSCEKECSLGVISCTQTICGESPDDTCSDSGGNTETTNTNSQ